MFFRKWIPICATAYVALHPFAVGQTSPDDAVKMNQIQVIGSHNSYHSGIAQSETKLMLEKNPTRYAALSTGTALSISNSLPAFGRSN